MPYNILLQGLFCLFDLMQGRVRIRSSVLTPKGGLVHPQLVHHQLPATNRQMALPILNPPQVCRKKLLFDCPLGAIKNLGWKKSVMDF